MKLLKPKTLKRGDTVALVNVAGAVYEPEKYDIVYKILQDFGLNVKESNTLRETYGYLAGTDQMRVRALNDAFADKKVQAILAMRGGYGCNRILDQIDYENIRNNPKILCGFSDITALHSAIHRNTGLITFHGPVGTTLNHKTALAHLKKMLFTPKETSFSKKVHSHDEYFFFKKTIYPGKVSGDLVGGNLALLTSLLGTKYSYNYNHKILFIEEVNEAVYRVDRMFSQLKLANVLDVVSGVVIGQFTNCDAQNERHLSLEEVLEFYLKPLQKPAFMGAMFGHLPTSHTLPVGASAMLDADHCGLHIPSFNLTI